MAKRKSKSLNIGPAAFPTKIVGVKFNNEDGLCRQKYIRKLREGQQLMLKREPNNEYDRNAIAVCTIGKLFRGARQLGYLSEELAGDYAPLLDAGGRIDVVVLNVTGGGGWLWWKKSYGVNIHITVYAFRGGV